MRAKGIMDNLKNGGYSGVASRLARHLSARMTGLSKTGWKPRTASRNMRYTFPE